MLGRILGLELTSGLLAFIGILRRDGLGQALALLGRERRLVNEVHGARSQRDGLVKEVKRALERRVLLAHVRNDLIKTRRNVREALVAGGVGSLGHRGYSPSPDQLSPSS